MYATYSAEDNKLRLYSTSRLSAETYAEVKAAGFKWAPKQDLFVAPSWSPEREDLLIDLCGEIGDEDYSPQERAADRAERFSDYRDKRRDEAGGFADRFEAGPSVFGHQNRARAERQAARHDRTRGHAVSQWSKAEYWQERTKGVISHSLYKSSAPVRRSRILRLEAEQRKHEKTRAEYASRFKLWTSVAALEGADRPGRYVRDSDRYGFDPETVTPALRVAYSLVNSLGCYGKYTHPRSGLVASLFDHLTHDVDPISPSEAAALWLQSRAIPGTPGTTATRWSDHYENRLTYEKAMLEAEGGMAGEAEMEPGGFFRGRQIARVYLSPETGRATSVVDTEGRRWNTERYGTDAYRAPTDEERETFKTTTAKAKAEKKATAPKAPPLVNPTDADAEKLQAIWNERAKAIHEARKAYGECPTASVWRMTQAEYSQRSRGSYGTCETSDITELVEIKRQSAMGHDKAGRVVIFKVRTASAPGSSFSGCRRVIILTDKPQKPIPWLELSIVRAEQPTAAKLTPRIREIYGALSANWLPEGEALQLIRDAEYLGWAFVSSMTQFGMTQKGIEVYKQHAEAIAV